MKVEVFIGTRGQAAAFKAFLDAYFDDQSERDATIGAISTLGREILAEATTVVQQKKQKLTPLEKAIEEKAPDPEPPVVTVADLQNEDAPAESTDPFAALLGEAPEAPPATEAEAKVRKVRKSKKTDEPAPADKPITIEDIRAAGEKVVEAIGIQAIQSTVAKFGADRMSNLRPEDYGRVIEHFGKIMNDAGKVL